MIDFLFLYEHKVREIDNLCLICAELEKRGYSTVIEYANNCPLFKYKYFNKPKVVVHFCLYSSNGLENVAAIVGKYRKLVNLQWEQVTTNTKSDIAFVTPKGEAKYATHICWGETVVNRLQENGIKNAILTGAVQLDFLKGNLINYYKSKEELLKNYSICSKKIITYISSFGLTELKEQEIAKIVQRSGKDSLTRIEHSLREREIILSWLIEVLEHNQECCVIYRPHPYESLDSRILDIERNYPQFRIIGTESVKQWILVSDLILTTRSTTITEVFYAKKPCIILRPLDNTNDEELPIYDNAAVCNSIQQLNDMIDADYNDFPVPENNFIPYYGKPDSQYAYLNISDLLEKVINSTAYDIFHKPGKLARKRRMKNFAKKLIVMLGITEETWPFSKIEKVRKWLSFFKYYREKQSLDYCSKEEINRIKTHIKYLI